MSNTTAIYAFISYHRFFHEIAHAFSYAISVWFALLCQKKHIMFCYSSNFLDLNCKYNHMGRSRRSWRTFNIFNIIIWMHTEAWACIFPILAKAGKIIEIVSSITSKNGDSFGKPDYIGLSPMWNTKAMYLCITWGVHLIKFGMHFLK